MASKSSGQLDQTGEEIISGSESFLSAKVSPSFLPLFIIGFQSFQDTSTHSSIVSSTPRIKIKNRTSTYDLEKSMAQFSISRKNPNGDGDRSRSFRTDNGKFRHFQSLDPFFQKISILNRQFQGNWQRRMTRSRSRSSGSEC